MIIKQKIRKSHLDVLLGLQDVEDSLQAVLLGDLVEGVGHLAVELDQVGQGAAPRAGDSLRAEVTDIVRKMILTYLSIYISVILS